MPPSALIGREETLALVCGRLRRRDVRLVTLTGPPGTGKTRLALAVAAELAPHFADGAVFVPLETVLDAELVLPAIARALDLVEPHGRLLADVVAEALESHRVLLVLDNFEQVLPAARVVTNLLAACPSIKALVTSRGPLRLRWEETIPVPPLDTAFQGPGSPSLASAPAQGPKPGTRNPPAIELFVQRAGAARAGFRLTAENTPVVAEICRRLDGLPLAIELAAARTALLTPRELLEQLDRGLRVLSAVAPDMPERHRSLHAAIASGVDLLTPEAQQLFRSLGVFAGGWTLEAAEIMAELDGAFAALDLLEELAGQSLVMVEEQDGRTRYRMLESVRGYAVEQLTATGGLDAARERHAMFFLALVERAEPALLGPERDRWLAALDAEHDNLRRALDWAIEARRAETALRLGAALGRYWDQRGHHREGRRQLERALVRGGGAPAHVRGRALSALGTLMFVQGDYAAARAPFEEALTIYQEIDHQLGRAIVLNQLGNLAWNLGDYDLAHRRYEESLTLRRELDDPRGESQTLHNLGNLASTRGDHATARAYYEQSLAIKRELGDTAGIAATLLNLGIIADQEGHPTAARLYLEESLAIQRSLGHGYRIAQVLFTLGALARRQGDLAAARAAVTECLTLQEQIGDRQGIWLALEEFAALANREGQPERAARLLGAAGAVRQSTGVVIQPVQRAGHEAVVAATRDALGEAAFTTAYRLGEAMPLAHAIAFALDDTGPTSSEARSPADAAAHGQRADQPPAAPARSEPPTAAVAPPDGLTVREVEVLRLLAGGMTNRELAATLFVSENTVERHLLNIYRKIGARRRADATAYALRHGLA